MNKEVKQEITLQDKEDIEKEFLDIFHIRIPMVHGTWVPQKDKILNKKFNICVELQERQYVEEKVKWYINITITVPWKTIEISFLSRDYNKLFTLKENTYTFNDKSLKKYINEMILMLFIVK